MRLGHVRRDHTGSERAASTLVQPQKRKRRQGLDSAESEAEAECRGNMTREKLDDTRRTQAVGGAVSR